MANIALVDDDKNILASVNMLLEQEGYQVRTFSDGASALTDSGAFTLIGGGDTGAAIRALGFPETAFDYVSTGGGATLEFIE